MWARWPEAGQVDLPLIQASQYVADSAHEFRLRKKTLLNQGKGGKVSNYCLKSGEDKNLYD